MKRLIISIAALDHGDLLTLQVCFLPLLHVGRALALWRCQDPSAVMKPLQPCWDFSLWRNFYEDRADTHYQNNQIEKKKANNTVLFAAFPLNMAIPFAGDGSFFSRSPYVPKAENCEVEPLIGSLYNPNKTSSHFIFCLFILFSSF